MWPHDASSRPQSLSLSRAKNQHRHKKCVWSTLARTHELIFLAASRPPDALVLKRGTKSQEYTPPLLLSSNTVSSWNMRLVVFGLGDRHGRNTHTAPQPAHLVDGIAHGRKVSSTG